jgi:hypothetical protein
MTFALRESNPGMSKSEHSNLVGKFGRELPTQVTQFLLGSNGGVPSLESCLFKYRSGYDREECEVDTVQKLFSAKEIAISCSDMGIEMGICGHFPIGTTGLGGALMVGFETEWIYLMEIGRHEDFSDPPQTRLSRDLFSFFALLQSIESNYDKMNLCNDS